MPDTPRFVVTCKLCRRRLVRVERLRDPEIALVRAHLRQCDSTLADAAPLGEVLRHLHVAGLGRP